jgi:hypothetical protein
MSCDIRLAHPEWILTVLWEFPGLDPSPKSSQGKGITGKDLARVPQCTTVRLTRYSWSKADNTFYVYVQAPQGEGWVELKFINLEP